MDSPTLLGIRQREFDMHISVNVGNNGQEAGLSLYQAENHHYDLFVRPNAEGVNEVVLRSVVGTVSAEVGSVKVSSDTVSLLCKADKFRYHFYMMNGQEEKEVGFLDTRYLSSEVNNGFTGVFICLYAHDPKENGKAAKFTDFVAECV